MLNEDERDGYILDEKKIRYYVTGFYKVGSLKKWGDVSTQFHEEFFFIVLTVKEKFICRSIALLSPLFVPCFRPVC